MAPGNPFNNLNDRPDGTVTAVVAVCFWVLLAVVLLAFAPRAVGWIAAPLLLIHAVRTWRASNS